MSMLNDYAFGHSCPYLGVTVSLQNSENSSAGFSAEDLQSRIAQAFIYTRWVHPMVACQIKDAKQMVYKVEEAADVTKWAARTVQTVESSSSWRELLAKLSREVVLPSEDGDCAFLYLVVRPLQSSKSRINQFDLLLHVHHGLADGAGIRSIMNEVLVGLTKLSPATSYSWGEEVERLSPTALDVAVISDEATKSLMAMPNEVGSITDSGGEMSRTEVWANNNVSFLYLLSRSPRPKTRDQRRPWSLIRSRAQAFSIVYSHRLE